MAVIAGVLTDYRFRRYDVGRSQDNRGKDI
jgi:hypothetical protein